MAMHIALAFGAPLGRLTVGGRFPGRLPPLWRGLAMVQAALLAAMASAMLDRAGVIHLDLPPVIFWLALGLTVLTFIANAISPSRTERLLWTPVCAVMAGSGVLIATM